MPAKFCVNGDNNVAVAGPRSREHCRDCYNSNVLKGVELIKFEVTAGAVTDARTQVSHGKGNVVELDPAETNIAALVAGGLGKVVAAKAPAKAEAKG